MHRNRPCSPRIKQVGEAWRCWMNALLRVSPWLLLAGLCSAAVADEVVLKNGSKIEGAVSEEGNKIIIDVGSGTVTVDRADVKAINKSNGLVEEYERRQREIRPGDVGGHWQRYQWSRQQEGFKARADRQLRKILEMDPNHDGARRALGFVNHKGAWLTQDEYKATLGLVKYNGEWVTADTAERLKRIDEGIRAASIKRDADSERIKGELEIERNRVAQRQ